MKKLPYKQCARCKVTKPVKEFYKSKATKDKYGIYCKSCDNLLHYHYSKNEKENKHRKMLNALKTKGKKYCPRCKKGKLFSKFGNNKNCKDGLTQYCIECNRELVNLIPAEKHRDRYKRDKLKSLDTILRWRFGISLEEYNKRLKKQRYKCAICGKTDKENGKRLAVDHKHNTKIVRGLLCANCNAAIGFIQENPKIALGIHEYLVKWRRK